MKSGWRSFHHKARWKFRLADPGYFKLVLVAHMASALTLGAAIYVCFRPPQGGMLLLMPLMFIMVTDMLSTQRRWFQGLLLSGLFVATGLFFCSALFHNRLLLLLFLFAYLFAFFCIPGTRGPFSLVLWLALLSTSTSGGAGWHNGVNLVLMVVLSLLLVIALYLPFSRPYRFSLKSCILLYADEITQAYLQLVGLHGAPSHAGLTYKQMMASFSAVSLKAGLLIHDRQYLFRSERLFALQAAPLHRGLRGLATDMSFLAGYAGQRDALLRSAPSTLAVLADFRRRLESLSHAMRRGIRLDGRTDDALYRTWRGETDAVLENRATLGMDCTRVVYGLTCFHEDLSEMEATLSDPLFALWWAGKRPKPARQGPAGRTATS